MFKFEFSEKTFFFEPSLKIKIQLTKTKKT